MRETFLGETFCAVFHKKVPVAKKFIDKRGVGASGFSVAFFLSHSTKNFRKGTLVCCVSEKIR